MRRSTVQTNTNQDGEDSSFEPLLWGRPAAFPIAYMSS
jgi:hypothetical protein